METSFFSLEWITSWFVYPATTLQLFQGIYRICSACCSSPQKLINRSYNAFLLGRLTLVVSCKIFEHFALQVDPVIGLIQPGSTPFKDSSILAPKLADPPFWWKSNSTPF